MFYALHRAVKIALLCFWLWVGWMLYQHRHFAEPAVIWYHVWDNGGFREKQNPSTNGVVEQVLSSQTFVMRAGTNGGRFNVRLLGLSAPRIEKEERARKEVESMIKGKEVRLAIAYENFNNLGGVVFIGKTNVNAHLAQRDLASTGKEQLKGLSKDIQYQMLWSKRHASSTN